MNRRFRQIDVFSPVAYRGNPVAVVLDSDGLSTDQMQQVARWMNLSETTFVEPPESDDAHYGIRIFTPDVELPFAGHPTLGTCHAWLASGGVASSDVIVQECAAGLIPVKRANNRLAFSAPPLLRSGPIDEPTLHEFASLLQVDRGEIVDAQWVDNGPGWAAVMLENAESVLAAEPDFGERRHLHLGLVGLYPAGGTAAIEVRAFFAADGPVIEDPVTGSLNASIAQWLLDTGTLSAPYVASQGARLGAAGKVHIDRNADGRIWVGGDTTECINGTIDI